MTGLLIALAVAAAVAAVWWKRVQKKREERRQPGATIHLPIVVKGFDEIDAFVAGRHCACGEKVTLAGETSRQVGHRRYRVVRLVCPDCGREQQLYFDVSALFH